MTAVTTRTIRLSDVPLVPYTAEEAAAAAEGHSWKPIDLIDAEGDPPEPPTISEIIYPDRVHVWSGEPETLKSLVAMAIMLDQVRAGETGFYVDLENGVREMVARLRSLGATDDNLRQILYVSPSQPMTGDPYDDTMALIAEHRPSMIVIDSYTGSLAIHNCDPNSAVDVENHHQKVVKPLVASGAGIVLLDHLVKNRESRGRFSIGSERKIGAADIHIGFETVLALSRGGRGIVNLVVHKDRPGYLHRPRAGQIEFLSEPEGALTWTFTAPEPTAPALYERFWFSIYMEKVSLFLETVPEGMAVMSRIEMNVGSKAERVREAIASLVELGYCREDKGARGAREISLLKPFRKSDFEAELEELRFAAEATAARIGPEALLPDQANVKDDLLPDEARSEVDPDLTSSLRPRPTSSLTSSHRIPFTQAESDDLVPPRPSPRPEAESTSSLTSSPYRGTSRAGRRANSTENATSDFTDTHERAPIDESLAPREDSE